MAVPSGATQTYQRVGQKEDVSDLVFNISPNETPFVTKAKKTKASNTAH